MVPAAWYVVFTACWVVVGIGAGLYLFRREAPYGRFSSRDWGPMVSNRWGWFLMETTVLLAFASRIAWGQFDWMTPAGVMVALFGVHYIHRSLVYPLMIRTNGKRMPLLIMLSAMLFNTVNGSLLGLWFARWAHYPQTWFGSPLFISGCVLFVSGMVINWRSDYTLVGLRQKGETGYKIPETGLFKYVSSPNLLGEIVEWGGYALLTWSLPALAFFVWTCANLIPRAVSNHRWYKQLFPDYPPDRKRLFPLLW
jgi:3-oxo-5-alpha-steroid 4-dehydrogenase 1